MLKVELRRQSVWNRAQDARHNLRKTRWRMKTREHAEAMAPRLVCRR